MIELQQVSKTFRTGSQAVHALHPTDLQVREGAVIGLLGFSGAGKSTLLRLINRLEEPSSGSVRVGGVDLVGLSQRDLRQARQQIGMIFQQFNLLSSRTALENVMFSLEVAGIDAASRRTRARDALAAVGLSDKEHAHPAQLSGGQKQRVAIARALATNPRILLCDEATSALDPHTALSILRLLKQLNRERGMTMVLVTHDIKVASYLCEQSVVLEKGRVVDRIDMQSAAPQSLLGRFFFETAKGWTDSTVLPQEDA
ncbi:MAG: ATP-binding cassette domain-containing protein [Rhodoferax sp.]|nr:ATP-binding cassette domain-containing protein [Rhodoferax sp.]